MNIPKQSPLKQIRRFCLQCMGGSIKSVRFCADINCSLWYLRFGKFPKTFIRKNGKKFEQLFDKSNFQEGERFCPNKEVSSYKL